jgi:hypothetical protein
MVCKSLILPVLIAIILVALGCDQDSPGEVVDEVMEPEQPAAGRVSDIVKPIALINDVRAQRDTSIFKQDIISTNDRGQVQYEISPKVDCITRPNSTLTVYPTEEIVFRVQRGYTSCGQAPSTVQHLYQAGDEVRLLTTGAVLGLIVEENQTTVKVARGLVEVQSLVTGSGRVVRVESRQQTTVSRGKDPRQPEPITIIDENEAEIFQQLEGLSEYEPLPLTPSAGPAGGRITFGCNEGRLCLVNSHPVREGIRIPTVRYDMYVTHREMKLKNPSQNSLFKATTYVRSVAEGGILGWVQE